MNPNEFEFDKERPLFKARGESKRSHQALLDYYELGAARSLRALLQVYLSESAKPPQSQSFDTICVWSRLWRWQERVNLQESIDAERRERLRMDAEREAARLWAERRMQIREQDWTLAEELRKLALKVLGETPKFVRTSRKFIPGSDGQPDREIVVVALDANLAVRAAEASSKLGRLAADMETEHTTVDAVVGENIEQVREKRWKQVEGALLAALESGPDAT